MRSLPRLLRFIAPLLALLFVAAKPPPVVGDAARAERLHAQALKHADGRRWSAAMELWDAAEALHPDWRYAFNLASSRAHLKRWLPAWEALVRARRYGVPADREQTVAKLAARVDKALLKTHAQLELVVAPPAAKVVLSGQAWPEPRRTWTKRKKSRLRITHRGYQVVELSWKHAARERHRKEIYLRPDREGDAHTSGWRLIPEGPAVEHHTATKLPDGSVLVVGGCRSQGSLERSWRFDADEKRFTRGQPMPSGPRARHSATLLGDGHVLVAGGATAREKGVVESALLYQPKSGQWLPLPPMMSKRQGHAAVLLASGEVLLVGGTDEATDLTSLELFDPSRKRWRTPAARLKEPVTNVGAIRLPNGSVLIAGGRRGYDKYSDTVQLFEPTSGRITTLAVRLTKARGWPNLVLLPTGRVMIVGGYGGQGLHLDEVYDPLTGTLGTVGHPGNAPENAAVLALPNGGTLLVGGWLRHGLYDSRRAFLFEVGRGGSWSSLPSLRFGRVGPTATLLDDGGVLVVGGREPEAGKGYPATAELFYP